MKKMRVLPLFLAIAMVLIMLVSPLCVAAQTPPSSGGTGSSTGSNGNTTGSKSLATRLGFNTAPPANQSQNPFGTPDKTVLDHMSIAMAGVGANDVSLAGTVPSFGIWNAQGPDFPGSAPFSADYAGLPNAAKIKYNWRTLPKVMTAANINGTSGYQQVLTAFLAPDGSKYDLYLSIEDYHAGTSVNPLGKLQGLVQQLGYPFNHSSGHSSDHSFVQPKSYIIPLLKGVTMTGLTKTAISTIFDSKTDSYPKGTFTAQDYKSHFQIVATKGRVAILVNNTLYDYKLAYTSNGYTATLARQKTFNEPDSLIDLKAGDVTNDGLQDLVVVVSPQSDKKGFSPYLAIYKWEQDNDSSFKPLYKLTLIFPDGSWLWGAAAAVGNVTGRGTAVLVSGYTPVYTTLPSGSLSVSSNVLAFAYVTNDAGTGKFNPSSLILEKDFSNLGQVNSTQWYSPGFADVPDLALVSFGPPNPGEPQYVFYDGWVFQYDASAPASAERFLTIYKTPSNALYNSLYYFDTAIGNFVNPDPDQPPAEQLAILVEEPGIGCQDAVYWYSMNNNAKISVSCGSFSNDGEYPALCGAVVKGTVLSLKYESYAYTMTDPKVVAVLGAPPYYQELLGSTGNGETTFGTSQTEEQESSNSINVSADIFGGIDVEVDGGLVIETKLSEIEAVASFGDDFTTQWSNSISVTTSKGFSAVRNDMVVVSSTPYDLFTYKISDPGNPKENGKYYTLGVPRQPQEELMNLSAYNAAVAEIDQIPAGVLHHTAGNPRTYLSVTDTTDNVVKKTVSSDIYGSIGDTIVTAGSFTGAGTGEGSSSESITSGTSSSFSSGEGISVGLSIKVVVGFFETGGNMSMGWSNDHTDTIGHDTEISGSVSNVPNERYDFNWELVGYKDQVNGNQFYVVNYVVNWGGRTPPPLPPSNFQLKSYVVGPSGAKATITWNKESKVTKYLIYRGTSKTIDTTTPYATVYPQAGSNDQPAPPAYTDNNLSVGQQYYYEVAAEVHQEDGSTEDSTPTAPLAVPEAITSLTVKTQPRLDYTEGDQLDLSALVVTATMADGSEEDMTLNNLLQRGMYFSITDGTELSSADNGVGITITDPVTATETVTNPLKVAPAASLSSFDVTTSFTVGSVTNATALTAGKTLTADIAVKNNEGSPQSVIAVVALFAPDGSMTSLDYSSQEIGAGATATFTEGGFTLPWQITGYVAKAFVLEGTRFSTSSLRPLSSIAQISS